MNEAASHELTEDLEIRPLTIVTGPQLGAIRYIDDESCLAAAQEKADAVRKRIEAQGWSVQLRKGQPAYVKCEGWSALAALCGLTPTVVGTSDMDNGGRAAVVELRDATGFAHVRADAECGDYSDGRAVRDEDGKPIIRDGLQMGHWHREPGYSKRSMAQTRAVSKACRVALSWVMSLAGYQVTPYEEVVGRDFAEPTGLNERLKACIKAMRAEAPSLENLFGLLDALAEGGDREAMREASTFWFELDDEAKKALWISPTDGGPFTTKERELMKSSEFRKLYYGDGENGSD